MITRASLVWDTPSYCSWRPRVFYTPTVRKTHLLVWRWLKFTGSLEAGKGA